jgi:hypothetical protein
MMASLMAIPGLFFPLVCLCDGSQLVVSKDGERYLCYLGGFQETFAFLLHAF